MALFRRSAKQELPSLTAWPGDSPQLPGLRAAVAQGNYDAVLAAVRGAANPERFELVWALADDLPFEWAASHVANDPGEAAAHALAGAAALRAGWRARTNERAEHVQTEQFKTFWSWLDRAESYLRSAAELDPADPTPLVYLLASARGLQHPREDVTSVFTELRRRDPGHLEGHRQMMQYVCEKWFGSHDEMFAFARGVSDQSPQGSPLHELPIFAHVERWADLSTDKPDEAKQRRDYFKATSVLAEIEQAKQRLGPLLTAPVDGSSVTVRNMLVVVAFGQDDRDGFVQAVSDVQGLVSPMPWNYFGADPVRVLQATWRSLSK